MAQKVVVLAVLCAEVLERVKLHQLQSVSVLSRNLLPTLVPAQSEPDDCKAEHLDWTQLVRNAVTVNVPFSGLVGQSTGLLFAVV